MQKSHSRRRPFAGRAVLLSLLLTAAAGPVWAAPAKHHTVEQQHRVKAVKAGKAGKRPAEHRAAKAARKRGNALEGKASYYASKFTGRRTASGERFDPAELTAAHRSLPLNSLAKVTDLNTGRSVVVRINDRGPHRGGRVIDLSPSAAREIGMIRRGIAQVAITPVDRGG